MCSLINNKFEWLFRPAKGKKATFLLQKLLLIKVHISASGGQSTGDFLIKIFCMSVAAHANAQGAGSTLGWMELQIF